eukprot:TRINITY_DN2212_c3_g1_i8.p1 TRINITY_DN2212_c3_g1~~TRINITY_DN2212_c3_g1_i8.p1  ORF type:complete len:335 (-),score=103.59 TRINITY_DN2212_c3_g1_i8:46-1050(-)
MDYPDQEQKNLWLNEFYQYLYQPDWCLDQCGELYEKELLEQFPKVTKCFMSVKSEYRDVIQDITKRMGEGMAEFQMRDVVTKADYDLYCHYVAGLVGIGLSKLFYISGLEGEFFAHADDISNSMGLFLQKTNIIRDYLEDINDKRIFWPEEVWSQYTDKLENFKEDKYSAEALACLNHLITDALKHIPDCLEYMSRIQNQQVFNFCAIPQAMAIATLAACYNNHNVFTGVVKIRRGQSAKIIMYVKEINDLYLCFHEYCTFLSAKIDDKDPNAPLAKEILNGVYEEINPVVEEMRSNVEFTAGDWAAAAAFTASGAYLVSRHKNSIGNFIKSSL